jgi:hypothetical protein
MAYNEKIEQSRNKVYNHAIATKILDLMDKLRMDENENSSRRWIWELLQNAKDVAFEDSGVSVEINFQTNNEVGFIEFKHNGKPFSIDNLTFLIEQVSTKERKPKGTSKVKTTGKFGTGFLTTHLLSEIVEVESVVKEPDEPYRKFSLSLDRSAKDIDEIIASVNSSLASLEEIDSQIPMDRFEPTKFNTVFRYKLDANGIEVAKKGLKDLHNSLVFLLGFLPEIKSVKIINENSLYELSQEIIEEVEGIRIFTVSQLIQELEHETKIAILSKNDTSIAVELEYQNDEIFIKKINPMVPRLFCDFPLIETESFPFPVLINNPTFNPTEPRDGVYLTDKSDKKIEENKSIMVEAVELYFALLEYASLNKWGNIYLLAKLPYIKEKGWLSKKWLENELIAPIREKLLKTPIVDTENNGRISILGDNNEPNIWFPWATEEETRNKIWDLINLWIPSILPKKVDIHAWYQIIWLDHCRLSIDAISNFIQRREDLNTLEIELNISIDPIEWLNSYYELLNLNEKSLNEVINDKYEVIPNQNGIFKKRSDLKIDREIEEELKNVLSILDVDSRDYLILRGISTGKIKYYVKTQEDIINEINKIIHEGKNDKIGQACDYLVTLFADDGNFPEEREQIFDFCNRVYPSDVSSKRTIIKWSQDIWNEVDKRELRWIVQAISDTESVKGLTDYLQFETYNQTINWMNLFISFLTKHDFGHLLTLQKHPILPNQNGYFRNKDDLFLDDGEIDEILKDISADLGTDFREELLDMNIFLELPQNRTRNQGIVAEEIIRLINPRLSEFPKTDETKQISKKLSLWFNKNKEKAEYYFRDLYVTKFRLYDDEEIAENMQKVELISAIMEEYGIDDLENLKKVLQVNQTMNLINQREQITQETLVSLGVTSIEELEEALRDKDIASQFTHTATPTVEMFRYAQGLIGRAKSNVINYLKTLPNYDCSEMEDLATTVIGGIKKDGLSIHVVVRPSDHGEVIIYYTSEKDTLDYENAELWIDNGIEIPRHLTLGKILKNTGINRIPV